MSENTPSCCKYIIRAFLVSNWIARSLHLEITAQIKKGSNDSGPVDPQTLWHTSYELYVLKRQHKAKRLLHYIFCAHGVTT